MLERKNQTLIDKMHTSILEENINDNLCLKILWAITYIKNNRPIKALLNNITTQKAQNQEAPNVSPLRLLESTVYTFLHKEKQSIKSEKLVLQVLKGTLMKYNSLTVDKVFIKN